MTPRVMSQPLGGCLQVTPMVTLAPHGQYYVQVINVGQEDIWMKPRTLLGTCCAVNAIHDGSVQFQSAKVDEVVVTANFGGRTTEALRPNNKSKAVSVVSSPLLLRPGIINGSGSLYC